MNPSLDFLDPLTGEVRLLLFPSRSRTVQDGDSPFPIPEEAGDVPPVPNDYCLLPGVAPAVLVVRGGMMIDDVHSTIKLRRQRITYWGGKDSDDEILEPDALVLTPLGWCSKPRLDFDHGRLYHFQAYTTRYGSYPTDDQKHEIAWAMHQYFIQVHDEFRRQYPDEEVKLGPDLIPAQPPIARLPIIGPLFRIQPPPISPDGTPYRSEVKWPWGKISAGRYVYGNSAPVLGVHWKHVRQVKRKNWPYPEE